MKLLKNIWKYYKCRKLKIESIKKSMKKYLKDEMQKYYEIIQCFKSMKNEAV